MTTTDTRRPLWRRTWVRVTGSIAALASPHAVAIRPAASTAPARPKAAPRPAHSTPPPAPAANGAVPARYTTDILQAGITAPVAWINSTGQKIVADWRAGYTAAWTDQNVLLPGGIYQYHLATFDQITARDFGVTPPAQGIQPAAPAPAAPAAPTPVPSQPSTPPSTPAFQPQTVLDVSGTGDTTTQQFTVNGAGDYIVYWSYQPTGIEAGSSVNFIVNEDNMNDLAFSGVNELGTGGSGSTHVYNDAGTHSFSINTEGANWTLKVVTAP